MGEVRTGVETRCTRLHTRAQSNAAFIKIRAEGRVSGASGALVYKTEGEDIAQVYERPLGLRNSHLIHHVDVCTTCDKLLHPCKPPLFARREHNHGRDYSMQVYP